MKFKRSPLILAACLFAVSSLALAADKKDDTSAQAAAPKEEQSVTHGSVEVEGHRVRYKAVAGTLILKNEKDKPTATMFYVAYLKEGVDNEDHRPVTFLYNGGPGSSTLWLHMGAFGPKRAVVGDATHTRPAPYPFVNNDYSLLDASDLVFVDAVGTGFSRVIDKTHGGAGTSKDFWGVDEDAKSFSQFITRFLTKYQRWNSPKYLFGESYGTTRSAVLSRYLTNRQNIDLNGVILLSEVLSWDVSNDDDPENYPGQDQAYVLALPTYAATAWYHHKLPGEHKELQPLLKEVEQFATTEYAHALSEGSELDDATFNRMAEKLHDYTGLPVDYIKKSDLRVNGLQFEKTLLSDSGRTTGRYDTRYTGPTMDPLSKEMAYDPQSAAISSAYVSTLNNYMRKDLKFGADMKYRPVNFKIFGKWDRTHKLPDGDQQMYGPNVMPDLAAAMKLNPNMKILLNGGYFDLSTPFFAAMHTMHHLPIPKELQKNIQYQWYQAGHMVYVHPPALRELHDRTAKFIEDTCCTKD
ncbi:MAG: peptidase S10 [Gammaproteobacteria bacterium]